MSRRTERFKYRPKKSMRLKCRTTRDRQQAGDEGWQQHWKGADLKVLRERKVNDEGWESHDMLYTVKLPSYITTSGQAKDYLSGVFYVGCRCSHDCCGHLFSNVWTYTLRRTKGKEHTILISYQRNV